MSDARLRRAIKVLLFLAGSSALFCLYVVSWGLTMGSAHGAQVDPIWPDSRLTPGAADSRVRQGDIATTICVHGYTAQVRHVTEAEKRKVLAEYHMPWSARHHVEIDHDLSLELGGSNDIRNLWPESYRGPYGARTKDKLETKLHRMVCKGKISLKAAQRAIEGDWVKAYSKYVKAITRP